MQKISNWGKHPIINSEVLSFDNPYSLNDKIDITGKIITYGNGRSYGDASLQKKVVSTNRYNSLKDFDLKTGILKCESGVLLEDIIRFCSKGMVFAGISRHKIYHCRWCYCCRYSWKKSSSGWFFWKVCYWNGYNEIWWNNY